MLPFVIPLVVRIHLVPFHSTLPVPVVHSTVPVYALVVGNVVLISPLIVIAKRVSFGSMYFASYSLSLLNIIIHIVISIVSIKKCFFFNFFH
ncbi:MAG: hypothetical protein L6V78_06440 [Clostridium sp.]|nr:MAG: hypothetical protein L6V78_06440 [Clostridium sp.]